MDIFGRKLEDKLRQLESRLADLEEYGQIGSWEWDNKKDSFVCSRGFARIIALSTKEIVISLGMFLEYIPDEDKHLVQSALDSLLEDAKPFSFDHHLITQGGATRLVHHQARIEYDEEGSQKSIIGYVHDITVDEKVLPDEIAEVNYESIYERYQDLFENANDAIFLVGQNLNYLDVNKKAVELFGYSKEEFLQMSVLDVIPEHQKQRSTKEFNLLWKRKEYEKFIGQQRTKDGRWLDVEINSSAIIENGKIVGSRDIVRDISERKRIEETIRAQNKFLHSVIESLPYPFTVIDPETYIIMMANSIASRKGDWHGRTCHEYFHHLESGCDGLEGGCPVNAIKRTKKPVILERSFADRHGRSKYIEVHGYPIFNQKGELVQIIEYTIDITDRKKLEAKLHELSITDELTGMLNRRGFMAMAEKQVQIVCRTGEELLVIYVDVDNLKDINDKFGHKTGDQVLIETSYLLRNTFRQADVIGRLGGDEFVVLLTDKPETRDEVSVEKRLQENMNKLNAKEDRLFRLEMSIGMAKFDHSSPCTIEELLSRADTLMYEQKREKKKVV